MPEISAFITPSMKKRILNAASDHLLNVADEIVVVDSFSDDKTGEICTSLEARFFRQEFPGYREQIRI